MPKPRGKRKPRRRVPPPPCPGILPLEVRALRHRLGISSKSMGEMFNYTRKDWEIFERGLQPIRPKLARILRYMLRDLSLVEMQRPNPNWSL